MNQFLLNTFAFLVALFLSSSPGWADSPRSSIASKLGTDVKGAPLTFSGRTADPFGIAIQGPFKGLSALPDARPPVAAGPAVQQTKGAVVAPTLAPTLEDAVQELAIGAVSLETRTILIGSRLVHEGDLLVLESNSGQQFPAWVQEVSGRGVLFCDVALEKHFLKAANPRPKELTGFASGALEP